MRTILITIITFLAVNCASANTVFVTDACAPITMDACAPVEATACDPAMFDACAPLYEYTPYANGYTLSAPQPIILSAPPVVVRQPRVRVERKITIERKVREVERTRPVIIQQRTILRCD